LLIFIIIVISGDGTLSVHDIRRSGLVAMSDEQDDELLSVAIVKVFTTIATAILLQLECFLINP